MYHFRVSSGSHTKKHVFIWQCQNVPIWEIERWWELVYVISLNSVCWLKIQDNKTVWDKSPIIICLLPNRLITHLLIVRRQTAVTPSVEFEKKLREFTLVYERENYTKRYTGGLFEMIADGQPDSLVWVSTKIQKYLLMVFKIRKENLHVSRMMWHLSSIWTSNWRQVSHHLTHMKVFCTALTKWLV